MLVLTENCIQNTSDLHKYCRAEISSILMPLRYILHREVLKHIPVIIYACGCILKDWKYFKIRTQCLCYRIEIGACLKDYFSQIYRLEKHSQSCPNMSQNWRRGFSALPRLFQTCTIVTSSDVGWFLCCWEINLLVILHAQFPENPLRKYINIRDIPDGKKDYFRCGLFSGSSRTPFFTDLSSACSVHCGLQPCPTCREQQLEHSLWLQCEWRRPVMI